ncbi:hypothetical protein OJF2_44880 [Aquisphaera giovannonii]|uniref:Uncharacterized protein n=1 Tax=Aquisphaera giovannonii TaxID=406548 RepID=A0A5B9W7D9_9BACT|nr:hypothetical protein [Aquisphaera giovannonii]QEH35931.1 hypothetical protein OJF2_44880 [Aquisphaera giovannonii]
MHTYPSDERRISDVERGRSCEAVVPAPAGTTLQVGDSVLFALSSTGPGAEPRYVKGGDSVLVSLTVVTDLGTNDPDTGRPLVRIAWTAPGPEARPDGGERPHARRSRRAT